MVSSRKNPFQEIYKSKEFREVLAHKDKPTAFPQMVDVELTNHCNLNCLFCGQQTMTRNKGFISQELLEKVVDECVKYKTPIRFIRWGEPFFHPEIIYFIEYIKSKGLLLHITTNGLLLTEKRMKDLINLELDSLIFSFQGATKERYEIMRNTNQYDILKENILKLVKLRGHRDKPYIHITSTMTDETKKEIDAFKNYWGKIVDLVTIGKTNLSRLSIGQMKSLEAIKKLEILKEQEVVGRFYRPCTEVYQKLSVDWDGKVSCCCADWDNFLTIGDINKTTLKNVWNCSKKLNLFRELLNGKCYKSLTLCSVCFHTYENF